MDYLYDLFGILLYERFVSFFLIILLSHLLTSIWTNGCLFYTLGYSPICLYLFCYSNCYSFGSPFLLKLHSNRNHSFQCPYRQAELSALGLPFRPPALSVLMKPLFKGGDPAPLTSQPAGLEAESTEGNERVVRPKLESIQKKKVIILSLGKRLGCMQACVHKNTSFNTTFINECLLCVGDAL